MEAAEQERAELGNMVSASSVQQEESSIEELLAKLPENHDIRLVSEHIRKCSTTGELERIIGTIIPAEGGKIVIQGNTPNMAHLACVLEDMRELLLLVRLSKEAIKRIFVLDDFQHHENDPHAKIINALGNFTALLGQYLRQN